MRGGGGRRNGRPPADEQRLTLATLRAAVGSTLAGLPRVLALVWSTSRWLTLALGALALIGGLVPALSRLADQAVRRRRRGGGGGRRDAGDGPAAHLAGRPRRFVVGVAGSLISHAVEHRPATAPGPGADGVQRMVMAHADTLDLAFFERAQSYDMLQQAQQQADLPPGADGLDGRWPAALGADLPLADPAAGALGPIPALLALLSPLPAFIASTRYGWQGYQHDAAAIAAAPPR